MSHALRVSLAALMLTVTCIDPPPVPRMRRRRVEPDPPEPATQRSPVGLVQHSPLGDLGFDGALGSEPGPTLTNKTIAPPPTRPEARRMRQAAHAAARAKR